MKKTTASVKDNRLMIMAPNARTASVMSLEMDKVKDGSFVLNETKDGGTALEFKPASRKTGDVIAVYNQSSDAAKALEAVFKAVGGHHKNKRSVLGFILYILKILVLTAFVIILLGVILFYAFGRAVNTAVQDGASVTATITSESAELTRETLPLGQPILVDQYAETLEKP